VHLTGGGAGSHGRVAADQQRHDILRINHQDRKFGFHARESQGGLGTGTREVVRLTIAGMGSLEALTPAADRQVFQTGESPKNAPLMTISTRTIRSYAVAYQRPFGRAHATGAAPSAPPPSTAGVVIARRRLQPAGAAPITRWTRRTSRPA
jgi:hypothetical protein